MRHTAHRLCERNGLIKIAFLHNRLRAVIDELKMANPRPEERSTQNMEDAARRTGERAAEQTTRIGQAAAEAGEEVARASADMPKQNVETLQQTWRSSLEAATS
ncbi:MULTISPECIES: hypothetical protein [Bradyrhizobium]|uniref:hypothetical protein n=1 Tax=Bradyrhizobium TaxID=374 RepID=UPI000231CCC1|nr:hypothetical protein [Bradyrhizobium japonicum]MCS3533209.1 hypothetical protein [Bradyrhizobium japonicum]MCS3990698.1 hypothetical protein [Bradyrhizobium japonicum]MCS4014489.1 hypothetical protein [Bradyrhizobium japonicum]MCS4210497.1 hypothetical protein [Bradyrhizobium japonicum]MDH6179747.1 hypothetical protein [Bradyrhizobium japonicum]